MKVSRDPSTRVTRRSEAFGYRLMLYYSTVNKLKGMGADKAWDSSSEFDAQKDKDTFRQYADACKRVKNFYREQHGAYPYLLSLPPCLLGRNGANDHRA